MNINCALWCSVLEGQISALEKSKLNSCKNITENIVLINWSFRVCLQVL